MSPLEYFQCGGAPRKGVLEKQVRLGDKEVTSMVKLKLDDIRQKVYVTMGHCEATMHYFAVPKGESDVKMVYDGTKSGLNACLYAPWFMLPDADGLVRTLDDQYWCIDNDYGEMFLNFWIHPELMQFSGMDLTPLYGTHEDGSLRVEVWSRCSMGQSPSPYVTVQQTRRLKMFFLGDPQDENNMFRWDRIELNLPGTLTYKPGEPWVSKRHKDGRLAADAHDYVDDLRGTAPTCEDAWQVGGRIAKTASFYGVQDAARKQRQQTQQPEAWAGVVCGTHPNRPFVSVTQTKWDRTKLEIQRLQDEIKSLTLPGSDKRICHKTLEQVAGFLNHIARAYPTIRIYLNGIYASMNAWRPDRDEEGWRMNIYKLDPETQQSKAPARVRMVSRMEADVKALEKLTSTSSPPERMICPSPRGAVA
ncbi:hypothetical protein ACA910_021820 [Epithemia clementina (nom. ined.)]